MDISTYRYRFGQDCLILFVYEDKYFMEISIDHFGEALSGTMKSYKYYMKISLYLFKLVLNG